MKPKPGIMIIAGEASGDMHGAALVTELKKRRPDLSFFGIGGDQMQSAGVELFHHAREMAFLGFFEVLKHYPFIRRVFKEMIRLLDSRKPDLVILIDYPGFNLRLAKEIKQRGIPVYYYISPQVWAWGMNRVRKMSRRIDGIAVIFPFEEKIYRDAGIQVRYVGHPLKDRVKIKHSRSSFFKKLNMNSNRPTVGLLPGSRRQEVIQLLPEMVRAYQILLSEIPDLQALIGMSPTLSRSDYLPHVSGLNMVRLVEGNTYEVMAHSDAVMVASGTATLETGILETPMVILYKMSPVSYFLGKMLVKIDHIGLVNIVAGKKVVPELVQKEASAEKITEEIKLLLLDRHRNEWVREELKKVSERLGAGGASARAAEWVLEMLDYHMKLGSK